MKLEKVKSLRKDSPAFDAEKIRRKSPQKTALRRWNALAAARLLVSLLQWKSVSAQQQQDPRTMNGGSILAMAGKECVVLAVDKRFGSQNALIRTTARPVLHVPDSTMVAFTGLEGDIQSLRVELATQVAQKYSSGLAFGGKRTISTKAMASLTSHILYRRKQSPYFVEPIIVGLEAEGWLEKDGGEISGSHDSLRSSRDSRPPIQILYRPYICSTDSIGAKSESEAFCCAGVATQSMLGTAESLWKPNLEADELVEVCCKAFLGALERDCLSGYGALIYLLTPNGITEYDIAARSD